MTTILEPLDSQMFDYQPDGDVQMDPSSADPWFQQEDIVLDDPLSPGKYLPGGAEIEMTDDNDTEYEMTDDPQMNSVADPLDAEDFEVLDASHAATPMNHDSLSLLPQSPQAEHILVAENLHDNSHNAATSPIFEYPPTLTQHSDVFHATNVQPDSTGLTSQTLPTDQPNDLGVSEDTADLQVVGDSHDVLEVPKVSPFSPHVDDTISAVEEPTDESEGPSFPTVHEEAASTYNDEEVLPDPKDTPLDPLPALDVTEQLEDEEDQVAENDADPHEISDGVYIEPPPAVLLSLSDLGSADASLFSTPLQTGRASPQSEHGTPEDSVKVLLQHLPTLYYEPLNNVYQALRGDAMLANLTDLSNAELVLEAYDLELVLSEDSIHAREVSLHDLNVLHDGCEIAGPLRLRLRTVSPRFSVRYQALQEQASRLHFATEGLEPNPELTNEDAAAHSPDGVDDQQEENTTSVESADGGQVLEYEEVVNRSASPDHGNNDSEALPNTHQAKLASQEVESANASLLPDKKLQGGSEEPESSSASDARDEHFQGDTEQDNEPEEKYPEPVLELSDETHPTNDTEEHNLSNHPELEGAVEALDYPEEEQQETQSIAGSSRSAGAEDPSQPAPVVEESYEDWEDEGVFDTEENNLDLSWDADGGEHDSESNQSSVTLRSHTSKRSFDELEEDEDLQDGDDPSPSSPGSKRARVD